MRLTNLFICLTFSFHFFAQKGFFGKKNLIEFNAHGNVPLINNFFQSALERSPMYVNIDNNLVPKRDWFNYGITLQNFHYVKKSLGIGLEIGCEFQNIRSPYIIIGYNPDWMDYSKIYIKHERLGIYTISIMPKIELASSGGTLPSGLSHQLGFGYTNTSIISKAYKAVDDYNTEISQAKKDQLVEIYKNKKYNGISILYQMNYRYVLSKYLLLNIGLRYSLNVSALGEKYLDNSDPSSEPTLIQNQLKEGIRRARFGNMIQFTLGLGFSY